MIVKSLKVVTFDCDGVLFDSAAANQAYYNHLLAHFDLPAMTSEQEAYVHMHSVHESLSFLFGNPQKARAAEAYRRQVKPMPFIRLMTVDPYLRDVLNRLMGRYKTAIATNRVDTMDRVLSEHRLEGQFDIVVTAADVPRAKPHPDLLLKVLDHFRVRPEEMIYIGDSSIDEIAARQAGVPFVSYNNAELEALAHIENLGELLELLN
jgi:HAD superfamily hydrolase (TIGR01549 family)